MDYTLYNLYIFVLYSISTHDADEGSLLDCPSWSPSGGEVAHMCHTGRNGLRLFDRPGPMVDCRPIKEHCRWGRSQWVSNELE